MPIEIIKYKSCNIIINIDEDAENPRRWDNIGTMICFHNRYNLGDKKHGFDSNNYSSWKELEADIYKNNDICVCLPLYLYDHSGITISTKAFSCNFDSGQIGFIYISKQKVRYEYNAKRISHELKERVKQYLINEVKTYDDYISGNVFCYDIEIIETGEEIDNCCGYYGNDHEKSGLLECARSMIDSEL